MSEGSERLATELNVAGLKGPERALAEEAVRIKARLDTLDKWINGQAEEWFELSGRLGSEVELMINAPLVEARQQALALRSLLAELARQGAAEKPAAAAPSKADELRQRRENRLAREA